MATTAQPVSEADFIAKMSADDTEAAPDPKLTSGASETEDQEETPAAVDATEHDDEAEEQDAEGEEVEAEKDDDTTADDEAEDVEETEESKAEAEATAHANEVRGVLEKAGLKLSLNDIPAEARPIVQKKLDHVNAVVTRALQGATEWRKEKATFVAEKAFREANPEMAITEILAKNPDLIAKVQDQLDKIEDPDKKRLFETDLTDARRKALETITTQDASAERVNQRADEIESYTKRACENIGIPAAVVEQAIALALLDKPEDKRDLTEQELDQIITHQARLLRGHTRRTVLEDKKAVIKERTKDKKTSTPAVRGGSGTVAPSPAGNKKPKNDAEFAAYFESKL